MRQGSGAEGDQDPCTQLRCDGSGSMSEGGVKWVCRVAASVGGKGAEELL